VILGTPAIAYLLYFVCNEDGCPSSSFLEAPVESLIAQWPGIGGIFSPKVFGYYCAWFFGLVALQFILPGRTQEGVELNNKTRLKYKLNGTFATSPRLPTG